MDGEGPTQEHVEESVHARVQGLVREFVDLQNRWNELDRRAREAGVYVGLPPWGNGA